MKYLPMSKLGAVEIAPKVVQFGIFLPGVDSAKGYAVSVKIIHEVDQYIQAAQAAIVPQAHSVDATYGDFWSGKIDLNTAPAPPGSSAFGQQGRYVYRYFIHSPTRGDIDFIIEHLIRAHARGVKIHIMARPPHKLKKEKLIEGVSGLRSLQDLGVKIHKLKHIKLHAKLILGDDKHAIIGSINLAPGSFDSRRELAIQVDDSHIIHRIKKTLEEDWENSHPLDLSDAALLAELEDYDPNVKEDLAISAAGKHHKNN